MEELNIKNQIYKLKYMSWKLKVEDMRLVDLNIKIIGLNEDYMKKQD